MKKWRFLFESTSGVCFQHTFRTFTLICPRTKFFQVILLQIFANLSMEFFHFANGDQSGFLSSRSFAFFHSWNRIVELTLIM